jgi:hypothetical protein
MEKKSKKPYFSSLSIRGTESMFFSPDDLAIPQFFMAEFVFFFWAKDKQKDYWTFLSWLTSIDILSALKEKNPHLSQQRKVIYLKDNFKIALNNL